MPDRPAKHVLLIGWDAADWQMIRPMIAKGWMPTLGKLIDEGVSGNLATIQPVLSPMLWSSIATGKRADKHGILGFVEPAPDRSGIRPVRSTSRKCKAIWNILSQNGLRSNVVSWYASHPAEPIDGAVVSDRYVATISDPKSGIPKGTCHPRRIGDPLADLLVTPPQLEADALLPFVPRAVEIDQEKDDRLVKLALLVSKAASVQAATCWLMQNEPWDLTAVYFSAIDEFGHYFMPYHPPRLAGVSAHDARIFGDVMTGCYRFHDMLLNRLLALAGKDTTVVLVSDHGFLSDENRPGPDAWKDPERWHRSFGIACIRGPGVRRNETLYGATLLDVTPTILSMLGVPVGEDMDGRPWLEIYDAPQKAMRIPTWETVTADDAGMHSEDLREDPAESAAAVQRLVKLGYIDPPSDDVEETIRKTLRGQKTNLAIALSSSRRAADAIPLWRELAAEHPEPDGYLIQLAVALLRHDRAGEAREVLEKLSEPARQSPFVLLLRASVALNEDRRNEAVALTQQAIDRAPDQPSILNRAADIHLRLEQWDDAGKLLRRSVELMGENPVAHDRLAQVHLALHQPHAAVDHALIAVGLMHFFPAAHYHLGLALQRAGQPSEAAVAFNTYRSMGYRPNLLAHRQAEIFGVVQDGEDPAAKPT
jgi:predicted AlkP superfamily phosphohydrolase/phosphomutase/tetratricopeptide (TPR) repeat protein